MKLTKSIAVGTAIVATLFAGAAYAEHHRGGHDGERPDPIERLDLNGDDAITKDEVDAARAARFSEIDANVDGVVTIDEMTAYHAAKAAERHAKRAERRLERVDSDGDGVISEAEFMAQEDRLFTRADADGDGVVTREEVENAMERGRRGGKGPREG